jgi:CRISPR-associated protein Cas1
MEEFRPSIADIVVLTMVANGEIVSQDFVKTNKEDFPIQMTKEAIIRLVNAYEARLQDEMYHPLANGSTNYRRILELQVRQMARIVRGEATGYQPVTMR